MRRSTGLVAVALVVAGLLLPQPAIAATSSHPRVSTVLASSQYVIVKQRTTTRNFDPENSRAATLYATDVTGQRIDMPGFEDGRLFLTGSIVVQAENAIHTPTDRQTIRYLDLDTGHTGTRTGAPGEGLVGAGPDGWVTGRSTDDQEVYGTVQQYTYVHLDGTRTDLGTPYPLGQSVGLTISDTGIVASPGVSDEQRFRTELLYQPWASIGTSWRLIYRSKDVQVGINCAPSSRTVVACERSPEEGEGEGPYTHGLISLTGGGVHWMSGSHPRACQRIRFATLNSSLVAIETDSAREGCTKGKLYRFSWSGALVSGGSHHSSSTSLHAGLGGAGGGPGRIVVSSLDQRHVDILTGVTRGPHVLVRV